MQYIETEVNIRSYVQTNDYGILNIGNDGRKTTDFTRLVFQKNLQCIYNIDHNANTMNDN